MAKSNKPSIRIHNIETDEVIDREMTDAEFEEYQSQKEADAQRKADLQAKETQRQAILDRLGLTADEAKLIIG